MSLESTIASASVAPIAGLAFSQLPSVASYVTSREEVQYVPAGGQPFSSGGTRVLRINCSGNGFIDLSSLVLRYTLKNDAANGGNHLQPLTPDGGSIFSELRVLCSGIEIERIGGGSCGYDRILAALNLGLPIQKRIDQAGMGWGIVTKDANGATLDLFKGDNIVVNSLGPQQQGTIYHKVLSGLANQHLFLPMFALSGNGFTLEYILHSDSSAAVNSNVVANVSGSTAWSVTDVALMADVVRVDEALMSSYASHLLNQKALTVPFKTYTTVSFQTNSNKDQMLVIPRTFSRLSQVLLLPSKPVNGGVKDGNAFAFPGGVATIENMEAFIQVGATKWPSVTYRGAREMYMRYLKALGYLASGMHYSSNSFENWIGQGCIVAFDLERVAGTNFSGYNTTGANTTITLKNFGQQASEAVTRIDVLLFHDSLLEVMDGTCQVSF